MYCLHTCKLVDGSLLRCSKKEYPFCAEHYTERVSGTEACQQCQNKSNNKNIKLKFNEDETNYQLVYNKEIEKEFNEPYIYNNSSVNTSLNTLNTAVNMSNYSIDEINELDDLNYSLDSDTELNNE